MNWNVDVPQGPNQVALWSSNWVDVYFGVIGLIVVMGVIMWVYRSMQRSRLYLTLDPQTAEPSVRWPAVVRYLILTPITLFLWLWSILLILTVAADDRSADELALAAAVVVGAARVLAHISPEAAHELGKTVPLAVVTLIILGGGNGAETWGELLVQIDANVGVVNTYYWALLALDVIVTALWFWQQRESWRSKLPGSTRRRWTAKFSPWASRLRRMRDFGKPSGSRASTGSEVSSHG